MSRLGNIGSIEAGSERDSRVMTRQAIERLDKRLDVIERTSATIIRNGDNITIINNPPAGGGTLPNVVTLAYPQVIASLAEFFPSGWVAPFGVPWKIVSAFMQADTQSPPFGAVTFTFKNELSSPSSSGALTFAINQTSASGAVNVLFSAGQRLYIRAPSVLSGLENIYVITFRAEAQ